MTHNDVTLQPKLVFVSALMLQSCSCRSTYYTLLHKLVYVKTFRHILVIYEDLIIYILTFTLPLLVNIF